MALTRRTTVYRIHTFSFPAHIFIECCPIKLRQHGSPCVLSFEQTIPHCFRKYKPSDQISSAGTILIQLQSGSIPAIYYEERGNNTTGVCRQLHKWRASAHQQRGPVQSCRHHIVRRWWRTYTGNVYRTNVECGISMICPFCTSPFYKFTRYKFIRSSHNNHQIAWKSRKKEVPLQPLSRDGGI